MALSEASEEGDHKVCVVGDACCGKTSLLYRLKAGQIFPPVPWECLREKETLISNLPQELCCLINFYNVIPPPLPSSLPRQLDYFVVHVPLDGTDHSVAFVDTNAPHKDETYEQRRGINYIRPMNYEGTHVYFICFSYEDPESLASITGDPSNWMREIDHHSYGTPTTIFIVGLCSDVERKVSDQDIAHFLETFPTYYDTVHRKIFTVSLKTNEGLPELLHEVTRAAVLVDSQRIDIPRVQYPSAPLTPSKRSRPCTIA